MWHRRQLNDHGTLRLRHQLAKDGCPESQVSIAKFLLDECVDNHLQRSNNAKVAVQWLVQSVQGGNSEAHQLLKQCFETELGITARNSVAVEKCLQLTDLALKSHRIGSQIFRTMSDSEEQITEETFQQKVELVLAQDRSNWEDEDSALTSDNQHPSESSPIQTKNSQNDHGATKCDQKISTTMSDHCESSQEPKCVTVMDVVTSVQQCLEGSLPLLTLERANQFQKCYRGVLAKYVYSTGQRICRGTEALVKRLGTESLPCALALFLYFLCAFGYSIFPGDVQLAEHDHSYKICYIRLLIIAIMLSCTSFTVYQTLGYCNVEKWLTLIKLFEPTILPDEVKRKYLKNTTLSFCMFFASAITLCVLQHSEIAWYPIREIFLFGLFVTYILDRTIAAQRSYVNVSLLLNLFLCLYKENYFVMPDWYWFNFTKFEVTFGIYQQYKAHINIVTISVTIALPYLYAKMASVKHGCKLVLLPHLMCLIWLNFACSAFKASETADILYSCGFCMLVLIVANIFGPVPGLIFGALTKAFFTVETLQYINVICLILLFIFSYHISSFVVGKVKMFFKKYRLLSAFLIIFAFAAFTAKSLLVNSINQTSDPKLVWNHYEQLCHRNAWYYSNTAEVQIACLPFKGMKVSFEGKVVGFDMIKVENPLARYFTPMLPSPFDEWFSCSVGEKLCGTDPSTMSDREKERCEVFKRLNMDNNYHLLNWNRYQFHLHVEVSSRLAPEVIIKVSHACTSFIMGLLDGDAVQISGILEDSLGEASPVITLEEGSFTGYKRSANCITPPSSPVSYELNLSLKELIKFSLFPLIQRHSV